MSSQSANRYTRIYAVLQQHFAPLFIDLVDESYKHQVPEGAESHFKLTLVSNEFKGRTRVERHRLVTDFLGSERQNGLHALGLALYSPEEWAAQPNPLVTPLCQHKANG